jgi:hypothetical protein
LRDQALRARELEQDRRQQDVRLLLHSAALLRGLR